jgi:hypothetical protein
MYQKPQIDIPAKADPINGGKRGKTQGYPVWIIIFFAGAQPEAIRGGAGSRIASPLRSSQMTAGTFRHFLLVS